jgi:hypothetical protein
VAAVASALVPAGAQAAVGPFGPDFRISFMGPNGDANYDAEGSNVAYNPAANEYLVVWRGDDNTAPLVDEEFEVFAQRMSASGTALGGRIRVSDMGPDGDGIYDAFGPSVAYNSVDGQYLVVWTGDDNTGMLVDNELEIYGQRLTAAGAEAGTDFRISQMGTDGNANYIGAGASVAHNSADNQYLVTWRGVSPPLAVSEQEIFGQRLTAGGAPAGMNFRISQMGPEGDANYDAFSASVAYNSANNQYLVTWDGDDGAPLANDESEIYGQRLTAAGLPEGDNDFRISDMGPDGEGAYDAGSPSIAYSSADNQYLVTWESDDVAPLVDQEFEIFGQRLTAAGAEVGAHDFRISDMGPDGDTSYRAADARVAYNPEANQFVVTWEGDDNTPPLVNEELEIFGQQLDAAGAELGAGDFRISEMGPNGSTTYGAGNPRIVYNPANDQYLVTWEGDDDTAPLVNDEFEIFGRRLAELPTPPGGGGTPGGGTPGGGSPGADTVAPQVLSLALSPKVYAAFPSGPSVRQARTRGTRVTYRLSETATTTFRVQRVLPGRRVRGRCVRPTRANRDKPRCKRYRTLRGRFRHAGAAGLNRFRFSGRLAGRKLRPGSYRLVATAKDAAANTSKPVRRSFRIIR